MAQIQWMTTQEVASYLNCSVKSVQDWRWRKNGPTFYRIGQYARYRREDVDEWLEARCRNRPGRAPKYDRRTCSKAETNAAA